jgi:hypothetical protein
VNAEFFRVGVKWRANGGLVRELTVSAFVSGAPTDRNRPAVSGCQSAPNFDPASASNFAPLGGASAGCLTVIAAVESPAVVSGLHDIAVVSQPIEQRGRHLGIAEGARPFTEGEIGGDDDRGTLVEPADEVEQELAAGLSERQIAEFIEDDEVHAGQVIGEPVVGEDIGVLLIVAEMRKAYGRHLLHVEEFCRIRTSVARDDLVVIIDQDRIAEAESLDTFAIWRICFLLCVRAFFEYGSQRADGQGLHLHWILLYATVTPRGPEP